MKGQREAILRHLEENGSITSIEAFTKYGTTRLSAIIYDLRVAGYDIKSIPYETVNRFGDKVKFAKYTYTKENK